MTKDTWFTIGFSIIPIIGIAVFVLVKHLLIKLRERHLKWMTRNEFLNDLLTISRRTTFLESLNYLRESMRTVIVTLNNEYNGVPKSRVKDAAVEMIYEDVRYLSRKSGLSMDAASDIAIRRFNILKSILGGKK